MPDIMTKNVIALDQFFRLVLMPRFGAWRRLLRGTALAKDSKRNRAIEAAADRFQRHGFARTTMGDIAQASEMSRPALYLIFPGKEEVFEQITGQPHPIASSTGRPNPSYREGNTNTVAP